MPIHLARTEGAKRKTGTASIPGRLCFGALSNGRRRACRAGSAIGSGWPAGMIERGKDGVVEQPGGSVKFSTKELSMRIHGGWWVAIVLVASPLAAAEPEGKVVRETWEAAYLNGGKAGYVHTVIREIDRDGGKLYRSTLVLDLTLKRFSDTLHARMERGTEETSDGKVTGVSMRQMLGKDQDLVLTGTVEEDGLHVRVSGQAKLDKTIPWNDGVVGMYREQQLFKEKKVKPGDRFSYLQYEPGFNTVLKVQVSAKDYEEVVVQGSKRKLLRVEAAADKIQGVRPPAFIYWLDKNWEPVRSETEMEGLGKLVFIRTTKQLATAPAAGAQLTEISQPIRLN